MREANHWELFVRWQDRKWSRCLHKCSLCWWSWLFIVNLIKTSMQYSLDTLSNKSYVTLWLIWMSSAHPDNQFSVASSLSSHTQQHTSNAESLPQLIQAQLHPVPLGPLSLKRWRGSCCNGETSTQRVLWRLSLIYQMPQSMAQVKKTDWDDQLKNKFQSLLSLLRKIDPELQDVNKMNSWRLRPGWSIFEHGKKELPECRKLKEFQSMVFDATLFGNPREQIVMLCAVGQYNFLIRPLHFYNVVRNPNHNI